MYQSKSYQFYLFFKLYYLVLLTRPDHGVGTADSDLEIVNSGSVIHDIAWLQSGSQLRLVPINKKNVNKS